MNKMVEDYKKQMKEMREEIKTEKDSMKKERKNYDREIRDLRDTVCVEITMNMRIDVNR